MPVSAKASASTCSETFRGSLGPGLPLRVGLRVRVGTALERVGSVVRRLERLPSESCLRTLRPGPLQQARRCSGRGHRWLLKPM